MINMNVTPIILKLLPSTDTFYFPIDVFQSIVGSFSQGETDFLVTCNTLLANSMPVSVVIQYYSF